MSAIEELIDDAGGHERKINALTDPFGRYTQDIAKLAAIEYDTILSDLKKAHKALKKAECTCPESYWYNRTSGLHKTNCPKFTLAVIDNDLSKINMEKISA